jgi:hypothetical protein
MADSVALTALVVALVALFATTGQLLQQYFATADGFRRCQPSVMGLWARKTKLRWRWREFRFETRFNIPRIVYGPIHEQMGKGVEIGSGSCTLIGTEESLQGSMTYPGWGSYDARRYYNSDELVCWVPLLAQLHIQGREAVKYFPQKPGSVENDTMIPVIQFVHKSWDFMPPEVVRPMASSTVSDIAIMARRLGMVWKNFDPGSGLMRAEGNGHVITSTMVRSLGTILQYTFTSRENSGRCSYIPVREADKLGFGLVEFDHKLFGPDMPGDLDVGSYEGIAGTLRFVTDDLLRDGNSAGFERKLRQISKTIKSEPDLVPELNDLVPLCSAMLSNAPSTPRERWLNRIPAPNLYERGVTSSKEALRVFGEHLKDFVFGKADHASDQSKHILSLLDSIYPTFELQWDNEHDWEHLEYKAREDDEQLAKAIAMGHHSDMTNFLRNSKVVYRYLVGKHILSAINSTNGEPWSPQILNVAVQETLSADEVLVRRMGAYFNALPDLGLRVIEKCAHWKTDLSLTVEDVEDAWFSMMFRAFCWQRSHVMISGVPPLPSEYWNSKMPVYIG